ncbi:MAG TPA: hypothetical protein VGD58_15255, partial [Herpetosiphonaceae bacterium]
LVELDYGRPDQIASSPTAQPFADTTGQVLLDDDFENGQPGSWPLYEGDGWKQSVSNGSYTMNLTKTTVGFHLYSHPSAVTALSDGSIEAEILLEGNGFAGLTARHNADGLDNHYLCWIRNDSMYGCSERINGTYYTLVWEQFSSAIKPNEVNTLKLEATGHQMTFSINGASVSFEDETLSSGSWGVYAETRLEPFTVHFERIAIRRAE